MAALDDRRGELTSEILDRVHGIADHRQINQSEYLEGLLRAVHAAVEFGYLALDAEATGQSPSIPSELLAQARLAARTSISLDVVLRRYFAGHALFSNLLIEEAERVGYPPAELKRMFRALSATVDRVLSAVGGEYLRELRATSRAQEREVQLIEGLLAGEMLDSSELRYDFESWHIGLVAASSAAAESIRAAAAALDRRLLLICRGVDAAWAWLGGRRGFDCAEQEELLRALRQEAALPVAIGEPARGLTGWRLTHRQAAVTLPIARSGDSQIAQYSHAPLLASALRDDLLATSLREIYLVPLAGGRDKGKVAMETLRAYFLASRNASSTAAALGISRHTVSSRLAAIEELLGKPVDSASAELETALRLAQIQGD